MFRRSGHRFADKEHAPSKNLQPFPARFLWTCDSVLNGNGCRIMAQTHESPMSRRTLLNLIGTAAGGAAMYQAMASLGHAAESPYRGAIKLDGDPKGASVLILGAGLAGLVAAYELHKAGYRVQVLEY